MTTSTDILDRILSLPVHFFVDIGAANDPYESQTETLLQNGWSGIMFECDPIKYHGLTARMLGKNVTIVPDKVTPDNIVEYLQLHKAPPQFFLSLDIDGYDYFVLKAILAAYTPQLIISEINEKIPPPIKFSVTYNPSYWWGVTHFYGYSISMLEDLLPSYGYKIDKLHYNNVIISPGTQTTLIKDIYMDGYLSRPDRHQRFYYNDDFESIYSLEYDEQLEFIRKKFSNFDGQYLLDGRVCVENTGQIRMNQPFGESIAKYGADERFSRYLEIGTWNGRGSTCCFYEGFVKRSTSYTLQSYEICESRAKEAAAVWASVPEIQILWGRMLKEDECPTFRQVAAIHPNLNKEWHNEDIRNFFWSCRYIPMKEPEVVLLDGAEYLTYFEFEKMKNIPSIRVFMLDDANIDKCRNIRSYLLAHPDWKRVAYSDTERNGWAIFEKIISSEQIPESHDSQEQ